MDSQSAKMTNVREEQRGYGGDKKVRGQTRQLLLDTEGLKVKGHSVKVPEQYGIKIRPEAARGHLPRLCHLRIGAGYQVQSKQ